MRAPRAGRALAVIVVATTLTGCTRGTPDPVPTADPTAPVDVTAPAAGDLRLEFEQHFGAAAYVLLEALRASARDRGALDDAVDAHVAEIAAALGTAYDADRGAQFERVWTRYASAAQRYGEQVEQGRGVGRARAAMLAAGDDLAAFMAETTDGSMQVAGTKALMRAPTRDIMRSLDAYAEQEYDPSYLNQREALADMIASGRALAAGVSENLPERYPGLRSSGPLELRSALRQLLGEHALLTTTVLRKGSKGSEDFASAAAALNGNTGDVVSAVDSIYGGAGGDFGSAWRGRISALAEYTVAAVEQPNTIAEHRKALRKADADVAALLAEMSDGNLEPDAANAGLRTLTDHLLTATDAYIKRDVADAQQAADQAYAASLELADLIGAAIVAHRPEEFPTQ